MNIDHNNKNSIDIGNLNTDTKIRKIIKCDLKNRIQKNEEITTAKLSITPTSQ